LNSERNYQWDAADKWSPFFSDFPFPYGFYDVDEYQRWLAEAGLKINSKPVALEGFIRQ